MLKGWWIAICGTIGVFVSPVIALFVGSYAEQAGWFSDTKNNVDNWFFSVLGWAGAIASSPWYTHVFAGSVGAALGIGGFVVWTKYRPGFLSQEDRLYEQRKTALDLYYIGNKVMSQINSNMNSFGRDFRTSDAEWESAKITFGRANFPVPDPIAGRDGDTAILRLRFLESIRTFLRDGHLEAAKKRAKEFIG